MFGKLSLGAVAVLIVAAQAGEAGYGGYGAGNQPAGYGPAGGYGAHSYKHSHPRNHTSTPIVFPSSVTGASGTSNAAAGAMSTAPTYGTGEVAPSVPLSTGVSSPVATPTIPLGTGSLPAPLLGSSYVASARIPSGSAPAHAPYPIPSGSSGSGNSPAGVAGNVPGPIGTGPNGSGSGSPVTTSTYATETKTGDATLTYTLGSGSSITVVTTTIKHTTTETDVKTVYATPGAANGDSSGDNSPTGLSSEGSPTTTMSRTSTYTRVVTVQPVESGTGNSPMGASASACAPQVTVTVTGEAQTVTVTAGSEASTTGESPINPALPSISSAPFNNGTNPSSRKHKTKCASSGFITRSYGTASMITKPTGSGGVLPIPISGKPQPSGSHGYGNV